MIYWVRNHDKEVIKMSIGDVTKPLAPVVIEAMHKAADEMGNGRGILTATVLSKVMIS